MPGPVISRSHQPSGRWPQQLSALSFPSFRWIYVSNLAFFFAMNGQFIVRSILAYDITGGSKLALGVVNLAVALPMLVISPFGGVVADRFDRRKLILTGQGILICGELFILSMLIADTLRFWHLVLTVFLMGVVFPFIMPARQAIVADIVGRDGLGNAMALQMGGMNAARVAAPALAAYLVSAAGIRFTYGFAIVLYLLALAAMSRLVPPPAQVRDRAHTVMEDLKFGFSYVARTPAVRALMVLSTLPMLLAMPFQTLLVVFADDVWHVGNGGLGLLQAVAGAGGLLGSVVVAWHGDTRRVMAVTLSTLLAFAGTLLLFALSPWFALALPLVLLSDAFIAVFQTVNSTAINLIIPDEVRGRVMSLMMMTFGLTPLGTLPVSAAAQAFGAPAAVAGAAAVTAVLGLALFATSKALRRMDATVAEARVTAPPGRARHPRTAGAPAPAGARPVVSGAD